MLFLTAFWPYFLQRYPSSRISTWLLVWKANLCFFTFTQPLPFLFIPTKLRSSSSNTGWPELLLAPVLLFKLRPIPSSIDPHCSFPTEDAARPGMGYWYGFGYFSIFLQAASEMDGMDREREREKYIWLKIGSYNKVKAAYWCRRNGNSIKVYNDFRMYEWLEIDIHFATVVNGTLVLLICRSLFLLIKLVIY